MRQSRGLPISPVLGALLLVLGTPIVGAAESSSLEITGGVNFVFPFLDTVYQAPYTPSRVSGISQIFEMVDERSRAHQALTLEGQNGPGLGVGVNFFPGSALGVQFLFEYARVSIGGENPPHDVHLEYTTVNFPFSNLVDRSLDLSFEWPDTEGSLKQLTLGFNGVARWSATSVVGFNVSGGLSYANVRGDAQSLGAFAAWLGGHAVIFSELYEMAFTIEPTDTFGLNGGGEVEFSISPNVAAVVNIRLFYFPKIEAPLRLQTFVSENVVRPRIEQIDDFIGFGPIELDPSYTRLLFGIKVKL